MKRWFKMIIDILQELSQARAQGRLNRRGWDY